MLLPSMFAGAVHVGFDAVGLVVTTAFPPLSTTTHNEVEAHETQRRLAK
jgi:hypothetical protein